MSPIAAPVHLDLGDQVASCRVPTGELDAGGFSDQTASAIAPDEILRQQRTRDSSSDTCTSTPVSSCAKPVTSRPR